MSKKIICSYLRKIIPFFLPSIISPRNSKKAEFNYIDKHDDYVKVIIRGLKGEVIKGNNEWEKIQISFVKNLQYPDMKFTIKIMVEGYLASCICIYGFPSDSQFTKSMEPKFSTNLSEYAKVLKTRLEDYINNLKK